MTSYQIDYVTPEIAKGLKEIRFDEPCNANYQIALKSKKHKEDGYSGSFGWKKGEITFDKSYFRNFWKECDYSGKHWLQVAAPLIQHAYRWFYETKKLIDYPRFDFDEQKWFLDSEERLPKFYSTKYDADIACLLKLIDIATKK